MKKLALFFGVALCLEAFGLSNSAADSPAANNQRTLTVQGEGKVSAVPDIATLSIEVSHDGTDLDPALTEVRQQMNKVLAVVKGQGIEDKDVRTDFFQVRPKFEYDKRGNPHPVGYTVTNRVSVKVRELKSTGKVLTAVLNAGATNVNGPDFEIDNPAVLERQALAAATRDAKAKAQAVAEAAGVQLGEILTINPQTVNWPIRPRPFMMRAMAMPAALQTEEPIAAGEQTLTGDVTATYRIQ